MTSKKESSSGQVILIILLVMTVGITIGLSLVSRTVSDIKISSQIADSSKAFSAAEAGIEAALKGANVGGTADLTLGGANATYLVSDAGNSDQPYTIYNVAAGNSQTIWLTDHNSSGGIEMPPLDVYNGPNVDVCWGPRSGDAAPNPIPAVEVTLLYYDEADSGYKIAKGAYDPSSTPRGGFGSADSTGSYCGSEDRKYHKQIVFSSDFSAPPGNTRYIFLRVNPLYNSTDLVVDPQADLPAQGKLITSTGSTTTGVSRKLNVIQGYASLPSVFDYTLFTNQ